jgi:hypothetical protein
MERVSEDLVQVSKAIAELEPAVVAFDQATGVLGPVREASAWLTTLIRYRRLPHQAKLLMSAAEKIEASGLPPSGVSDKLLRAILEDGPLEDDEDMQDRWSSLLANAATTESAGVRIAFPKILSELEPSEAAVLDEFASRASEKSFREKKFSVEKPGEGGPLPAIDNLTRLGLIRLVRKVPTYLGEDWSDEKETISGVKLTKLGWDLVQACRGPSKAD